MLVFFFSSRRRHTRWTGDWSSDVCSSDLSAARPAVHTWTEKAQHDFVTEVDRAAEGLVAETIMREVPESVIVGEELSPRRTARGEVVWIVDPLDGTTNFLHGYPQYAVSIGCILDGKLAAGVVHDVC